MSNPLGWLADELQSLRDDGLFRHRREVRPFSQSVAGRSGRIMIHGREVWDFASNNYLGLASDPAVQSAAEEALKSHGVGSKASPLVSGRTDLHSALESAIAEFEGTESAILFPTGMAANLGTVAALAGPGDAVFCDRFNHASLVDGCRLSGARLRVYRHEDLDGLRKSLSRESARRLWIVTDTVFSMDGDLAPLPALCEIAEAAGAGLIVDEAHGTGVFGSLGRGVAELQHVEDRIAVRIGTLSKAIGALGGFVSGSQTLIDYLWNKARTQVYSTALPPALCAAAIAAFEIIRTDPCRRTRLHHLSSLFRNELQVRGIHPRAGSVGPIVPIEIRDPHAAVSVAEQLQKVGFLVAAIRPPTVPAGTSRLRVTINCELPGDAVVELADHIGNLLAGLRLEAALDV
ncbi:aminotransferase class I/II-fold pyridoxal phosphate-dependent enzyme [Schlesneria sp. DSM 10557]|uniref:aminotransferase class I/II-fold pyridoxal phosphate-dependent enzyme n=1 Tax=Schlesneria sp. DSM 10557 TaxID=3044399 RepID=UPI0035A03A5F